LIILLLAVDNTSFDITQGCFIVEQSHIVVLEYWLLVYYPATVEGDWKCCLQRAVYAWRGRTLRILGLFCNSPSGSGVKKDAENAFGIFCFQIPQAGNWI